MLFDLTVIGVGNTIMGDDGVGPRLIERLRADPTASAGNRIEYLDGGAGGLRLLNWIEQARRLLFVDAARFAAPLSPSPAGRGDGGQGARRLPPGSCRLFRLDDNKGDSPLFANNAKGLSPFPSPFSEKGTVPLSSPFSLHQTDLLQVLALARRFYSCPPAWLLAIQVGRVEPGERLSPELEQALPRLVETVKRLARRVARRPGR